MIKLNNIDKTLILFSALLAIICCFFIRNDYLLITESGFNNRKQVGQLLLEKNDIRVRQKGSVVWNPIGNNKKVFNNQLIYSGNESSASIELLSGSSIKINNNSLIEVSNKDGLLIHNGTIEFDLNSSLTIVLFGNEIVLNKGSRASIKSNKNLKSIEIRVHRGSVSVNSGAVLLTKDSITNIESNKIVKTEKFNLKTIRPFQHEKLYSNSNTENWFEWEKINGAASYELQISSNKHFEKFESYNHIKNKTEFPKDIKCKKCFWRVKSKANNKPFVSLAKEFSLDVLNLPVFHQPSSNVVNSIDSHVDVVFGWSAVNKYSKYEIKYSKRGKKNVTVVESEKKFTQLSLDHGLFDIHIRGKMSDDIFSRWSKPFIFQIKSMSNIPAPIIVNKVKNKYFINILEEEHVFRVRLKHQLKKQKEFHKYVLKISSTPGFLEGKTRKYESQDGLFSIEFKIKGIYYWKAQYETSGSFLSSETKIRQIEYRAPKILPSIKIKEEEQILNVMLKAIFNFIFPSAHAEGFFQWVHWPKLNEADSYFFELFHESNLENPIETKRVKPSRSNFFITKPGVYYWRVSGIDKYNRNGIPSRLVKISVKAKDIKMQLKQSISKKAIVGDEKKRSIFISWDASKFHDNFKIKLINTKNKKVYKYQSTKPSIRIVGLSGGQYEVEVFGYSSNTQLSSAKSSLDLKYRYKLKEPKIEEQTQIDEGLFLSWSPSPFTVKYIVELSKDPSFKKNILSFETKKTSYLFEKGVITPHEKFYIRIKAISAKYSSDHSEVKEIFMAKVFGPKINLKIITSTLEISNSKSSSSETKGQLNGFAIGYQYYKNIFAKNLYLDFNLEYLSGEVESTVNSKKFSKKITPYFLQLGLGIVVVDSERFELITAFSTNSYKSFKLNEFSNSAQLNNINEISTGFNAQGTFTLSDRVRARLKIGVLSLPRLFQGEPNSLTGLEMKYYYNKDNNINLGIKNINYGKLVEVSSRGKTFDGTIHESYGQIYIGFEKVFN